MSPFKLRQVARVLRGRRANEGHSLLQFIARKSARLIGKALKSAMANAESNFNVPVDSLVIDGVIIEGGSKLRRHLPVAKGVSHPLRKRASHIRVILSAK
jgi:large subunit ribosomal protein L22